MTEAPRKHLYGRYGAEKSNDTDSYLWRPVLEQLSFLPAESRVLDAGCGNGYFSKQLHESGFDVVGIDLEETAVLHARNLCPEVRFEIASVYDDLRSLLNKDFDGVVSLEVVEHLYDPRTFLRRVHACLRPGGVFVVSTPYHGYLKNLAIALVGGCDSHFTSLWDGGHIKFWSRRTLGSLLEQEGFRVARFIGAGRFPFAWKSMILVAFRQ